MGAKTVCLYPLTWALFLTCGCSYGIYSSVETSTSVQSKTKTVPGKKFKDLKIELSSVLEQMKKSEELHKKREEEHLAMIAAMQRCIDDLEGINNSMKSWCSVDEQEKVKFYTCDDIGQCPTGILYPLQ